MNPVIKIAQGQLKGLTATALGGHKFYQFFNIPFGKIPKRFSDPIPADSWKGIRDCTEPGDICFQRNENHVFEGSENCLNLNVYTRALPNEQSSSLKPVMVWIHGGGFMLGSNQPMIYNPEYLLSEDIVLVTINYRLGLLGLLRIKNEQNENIGGNMALKDQLQALKWVRNNISHFNGDPNNVTLFGESAGSVSVHYHVLSPKSRGYFHKAIMQSGVSINHWADADSEFPEHSARQIAKIAGYNVNSESEALEVLRNVPVEEVLQAQFKWMAIMQSGVSINHWADADSEFPEHSARQIAKIAGYNVNSESEALEVLRNVSVEEVLQAQFKWMKVSTILCPCIEKPSENAFLTERPIDMITSGNYNKVPMIFGYNSMEGLLFISPLFSDQKSRKVDKMPFKADPALTKEIANKLENFYFKGRDNRIDGQIDFLTDSDFTYGIITSAETHTRTNCCPVYLYKMTLDSSLNFFKRVSNLEEFKGAAHGDDLGYIFNTLINPPIEPGSDEEKYIRRFVKMWTNFAISSNPTPNDRIDPNNIIAWNPITPKELNTLVIDKELIMTVNPDSGRMQVWKEIYQKHPNSAWSKTWSKL